MKNHIVIFFLAILGTAAFTGCGSAPANNAVNAPKTNAVNTNNTAPVKTDDPVATQKKPEVATTNAAPTIGPVVKAYFDAMKKKDDAAIQAVISAKFLATLTSDMKKEKKTGLASYIAEYELGTGNAMEARNEKIDGDKAVAEVRGGAYANWTPFIFIKENGAWKYTGDSPELQSVSSESTTGKNK
jgi:hypothetical protein